MPGTLILDTTATVRRGRPWYEAVGVYQAQPCRPAKADAA